eukprot:Sspe_Gene.10815::Locus_3640_Transcript_5_5_Confidence_0.500_Length_2579::g.10815::m.10815
MYPTPLIVPFFDQGGLSRPSTYLPWKGRGNAACSHQWSCVCCGFVNLNEEPNCHKCSKTRGSTLDPADIPRLAGMEVVIMPEGAGDCVFREPPQHIMKDCLQSLENLDAEYTQNTTIAYKPPDREGKRIIKAVSSFSAKRESVLQLVLARFADTCNQENGHAIILALLQTCSDEDCERVLELLRSNLSSFLLQPNTAKVIAAVLSLTGSRSRELMRCLLKSPEALFSTNGTYLVLEYMPATPSLIVLCMKALTGHLSERVEERTVFHLALRALLLAPSVGEDDIHDCPPKSPSHAPHPVTPTSSPSSSTPPSSSPAPSTPPESDSSPAPSNSTSYSAVPHPPSPLTILAPDLLRLLRSLPTSTSRARHNIAKLLAAALNMPSLQAVLLDPILSQASALIKEEETALVVLGLIESLSIKDLAAWTRSLMGPSREKGQSTLVEWILASSWGAQAVLKICKFAVGVMKVHLVDHLRSAGPLLKGTKMAEEILAWAATYPSSKEVIVVYDKGTNELYTIPLRDTLDTVNRREWLRLGGHVNHLASVCINFQNNNCRAGDRCNMIHVDRRIIRGLRPNSCCAFHGDPRSKGFGDGDECVTLQYVRLGEKHSTTVPLSRCARSGWEFTPDAVVTENQVCRQHQKEACGKPFKCKFLHICRQLWWEMVGPDQEAPSTSLMPGMPPPASSPMYYVPGPMSSPSPFHYDAVLDSHPLPPDFLPYISYPGLEPHS